MIYAVTIKRTVYTILHVAADSPAHAVARAEMRCPPTGPAWQIKSEKCEVMGVAEGGKALSEGDLPEITHIRQIGSSSFNLCKVKGGPSTWPRAATCPVCWKIYEESGDERSNYVG